MNEGRALVTSSLPEASRQIGPEVMIIFFVLLTSETGLGILAIPLSMRNCEQKTGRVRVKFKSESAFLLEVPPSCE